MSKYLVVLLFMLVLNKPSLAFRMPTAPSLAQLTSQSDAIFVGKIVSSPPRQNIWIKNSKGVMVMDKKLIPNPDSPIEFTLFLAQFRVSGSYTLDGARLLKGEFQKQTITFAAPPLSRLGYDSSEFQGEEGSNVIAFFKSNKEGNFTVADDLLYFIPIDKEVAKEELSGSTSEKIRTLMMKSLAKGSFVQPLSYLLRDMRGNEMISISAKLVKSDDAQVRDYALSNLVINQQIGAIPLIVEEGRAYAKDNRVPANAVFDLWKYKAPEAAEPLQPLLFEAPYFFRNLALEPLSSIGNENGIPYYILTLLDTRHEGSSAARSAYILHRLTNLPVKFEGSAKLADQQATFQQFIAWWQDELSGKHPANADEKPAVELRQAQRFTAADLPQLNQGLFMKSEITRRAAMRGLQQFADQSSVPYLLIALYDPQPEIAYDAYTLLHRLVPDLGAASASQWKNERAAQTKAAFDWWQQHLLEADKPPTPKAGMPIIRE